MGSMGSAAAVGGEAPDLPLITDAINDYYRDLYADPDLGPIFKGVNMLVLRQHVAFFLSQVLMFDAPMSARQLEFLRKVHQPVIAAHAVTTRHYDAMLELLMAAMRTNGAKEAHLLCVQRKLLPLRALFPGNGHDAHVEVAQQGDSPTSSSAAAAAAAAKGRSSGTGGGTKAPSVLRRLMQALGCSGANGMAAA